MPSNIDRGRLHPRDTFWDGKRKPFIIGVCFTFLLLQILFLGNLSYLYGVVFRSSYRTHNLEILNVNLDTSTSSVQGAINAAYSRLQGDGFFNLQSRPSTQYASADAAREAVCKGHFWAAVVINEGASSRLSSALAGGEAAETYDSSDAATLVINSAKYSTASLGEVVGNLQTLLAAASQAYTSVDRNASSTLDISSVAAVTAFRSPISSKTVDIMPTNQGSRVLYNTVSMVFPIIQQFFFLMALNGLSTTYKLYTSLRIRYAVFMRGFLGTVYTFISSLCMAGYIWAFREDWGVEAGQFVLTWMVLWLYMFINFGLLDTLTAFVPMSFVPFFMITWVVINVASTIYPLALTAGFYHWGVALPAYNTYNLLVEVWTHGCNPMHAQCLGVLFAWAIVGIVLANIGMWRRCAAAAQAEQDEQDALQKRIDEANASHRTESAASTSHDRSREKESSDSASMRRVGQSTRQKSVASTAARIEVPGSAYSNELRRIVSPMDLRLPFADTIEGLGRRKMARRNTEPVGVAK